MKPYFLILLIFAVTSNLIAQAPWKLTRDFNLAFQDSYIDNFRLVKKIKEGKIYYIGYDKEDTAKKIFSYEKLLNGQVKDGWFSRFDSTNKKSFNILFQEGIAKRLTYIDTDSLSISYYIDSNLLNGQHLSYYNRASIKEAGNYKNNARIGEWLFFNNEGKLVSQGNYAGDYKRLLYDVTKHRLITLNRFLDTIRVENFNQKIYDSLTITLGLGRDILFPVHLHFKIGEWKYYNDTGKLIRREFYSKGVLTKTILD